MKTTDQFLSELRDLDVKLWVEGDRLRYRASKETLTPPLLQELRSRETEILAFLHKANTAASSNLPPILPVSRNGELPASFAQQRLWFLDQLQPGTPTYNIFAAYRFIGKLNLTALEQSLGEIVRRHESLRTTFYSIDGQPTQAIAQEITLKLLVIDLQQSPARDMEAQRWATDLAQQPFDLACDPLLRVKLLRLDVEEHVLLLSVHHIVFDGWSLEVFFQELTALYSAFAVNQPSPLPELPLQYADFAHWQRQWLQGEVLQTQLDYWKQHLGGTLPVLELPTDRPRPAVTTYRGAICYQVLSETLTTALKALSQQSGTTLTMTLLAAFNVLLNRYSGQEDIIVGSPIAGRNCVETEAMIGFFVNTLALRTNLSGNPSFQELLLRVRNVSLEAYAHQDVPFEKLVEELRPERDRSRSPLFQVMFGMLPAWIGGAARELPGMTITSTLGTHTGTSKFDLTLNTRETGRELEVLFEYNTDLFDAATITRMLGHFQTLLEGIVAHPQQRISDLPILTAAERHQLLVEWNTTQTDYPPYACLHQLFEAQVSRTPDTIALVFESQQLTYKELDCRASQLANYLKTLGVGPEVLVGICIERSIEMVVGVLGILKAGGAYVPLDPAYPQERIGFMLEDSQVSVLLTQHKLKTRFPNHETVICLDTDWQTITTSTAQDALQAQVSSTTGDNLAYIIYTSGSTGKPKGVQIQHRSAVNLLNSISQQPGLTSEDTLLSVTTLSFDIAVSEIFLPLSVGAKLVLLSREAASDGTQLLKALASGATFMQPTPATWRLLLAAGWQGSPHLKMISTGEALPKDLANQLLPKGAALWNLYGPTETTIWSTAYQVKSGDGPICIGRPIANTQLYILDSHFQPVPIGVPGELYIGGDGLARGYLNRPELTLEKFIANPFSPEPGARLYKTGDLARYLPDGIIECLGRIDHQVKLRGFRIELEEIQTVLSQHPDVRQAVVIAREDNPGNQRLVAYIVPNWEQVPSASNLRSFLKQQLPEFMVPSAFVMLESLPLTPNGKIDRRALPAPDRITGEELAQNFVPASDELELQLTQIWQEVLGVERIGVKDNFFELGGHSLLAVRLFAQIEKTFSINLPIATLFQAATIEQLADILRQGKSSEPWSPLVEIQPGNNSKPPMFCIHGGGFNVLVYRELALNIGSDQPVYGLQARGLDGDAPFETRIEGMATDYVKQIQTIQPQGPYFLVGLSNGGNIALEMAQQLQAQGQKVSLLALLDSYGPDSIKLLPSLPRFLSSIRYGVRYSLPRFVEKLFKRKPGAVATKSNQAIAQKASDRQPRTTAARKNLSTYFNLEYWMNEVSRIILARSPWAFFNPTSQIKDVEGAMVDNLKKLEELHRKAQAAYVPKAYSGHITLFRAGETPPGYHVDPQLGWGKIAAGGLEIYRVPGHHVAIVESPILAEKLRDCLDRVMN